MSKAEEFIQENTKNCSSDIIGWDDNGLTVYQPWLTLEQARKALKIEREEIYEWLANHYRDYMHNPTGKKLEAFFGGDMINDLKEAMGDE